MPGQLVTVTAPDVWQLLLIVEPLGGGEL